MPGDEEAAEAIKKMQMGVDKAVDRFLELYEKRTQVLERIAMAMEHNNEQKWHAVR